MSFATRLSAFFLAALAVILLGFSAVLYGLARDYLYRQHDQRLETVLDTLEAAIDVETDGLEWEPADRRLMHGIEPGVEHVRWAIYDGRGAVVDCSSNAVGVAFPPRGLPDFALPRRGDATAFANTEDWRLAARRLTLVDLLQAGRRSDDDDEPEDDDQKFPELVILTGITPAPVVATLNLLALVLFGTSAVLWLVCAALGRTLAHRALAPLCRMANAARTLNPSDSGWGLPLPGTGDELEKLAVAYNDLLARLHEAFERQRRLAGDASHQLRTPLAGLLAQIDVALRRDRPAEEYRRTLGIVRDEADRLRRITEALLFLARPDSEGVGPEAREIALARWLPEQLRRWANHPRTEDIHLDPMPEEGLAVRAHPVLLAQLLDNLVDNAIKYSEPGSPVRIGAWTEGTNAVLAVVDRGPGLSREEQAHIFEPFYRSEQARRRGRSGSGLGLAVAQRLATIFGGSLDVLSEPGFGSGFRLRVPAVWAPRVAPYDDPLAPIPMSPIPETIPGAGPG